MMRKTHSEKTMLNNFLKAHAYRLYLTSSPGSNITTHPLRNIEDVSIFGGWCSTAPPGDLAQHGGSSGGARWDGGVGVPAGGRNTGKQGPHPKENTLSSSTVGLCDWAWQLSGGG